MHFQLFLVDDIAARRGRLGEGGRAVRQGAAGELLFGLHLLRQAGEEAAEESARGLLLAGSKGNRLTVIELGEECG